MGATVLDLETLDELGNAAASQLLRPVPDLGPLRRRARTRRARRRLALAGTALAALALVGTLTTMASDGGPGGGQLVAAGTGEQPVPGLSGAPLGNDAAIWPADPMPLEDLRAAVSGWLGWPSVDWDEASETGPAPSLTGHHPDDPDRRVVLNLVGGDGGYRVAYTYPFLAPALDADGQLIGVRGVDFGPDTVRVELYRSDSTSQYRVVYGDQRDWADVLRLPLAVAPAEAGSLLAIGRDDKGEATVVAGVALDRPEQLTVAIDRLTAASVPAPLPLPDPVSSIITFDLPRDAGDVRLISDIASGVDLYFFPSRDRSTLTVVAYERGFDGGASGSGADAANFNRQGVQTSWSMLDRKYSMYVLPDGVTIGDLGGVGRIDPSGSVLVIEGHLLLPEAFEIVDGALQLRQP